jgi:hypothetical protein
MCEATGENQNLARAHPTVPVLLKSKSLRPPN